ncbi:resuscitation-promoting factor [Sanguibacter sp. Leaf3]|uniref:resuscitation-promoting factor n=1 Tax=Sanguibacter sp. Leaf3 TaxID=1736209 RepID=UPI000B051033|nr:resuscitation-promoting factor [Sanguibacter sp. Leaf3]
MKNLLHVFSGRAHQRGPAKPGESTDLAGAGLSDTTPLSEGAAPSTARRSRRTLPLVVGGVAVAVLATGTAVYANAHKTVMLDIDGQVQEVSTFSGSVEGVLAENDVTVGPDDLVAPAAASSLTDGADVVVRYSREITLQTNGNATTIKTTAVDADELLSAYADRGADVSLVASRSQGDGRTDLGLRLSLEGPVQVQVDGTTTQVEDGTAGVDTILEEQGVELGELDRLSVEQRPTPEALEAQEQAAARAATAEPAAAAAVDATASEAAPAEGTATTEPEDAATTAPANPDVITDPRADDTQVTIVVQRVAVTEETATAPVPFETVTEEDPTRYADLDVVTKVEGVEGLWTAVSSVTTVDGVEESRELVSDELTTAPVTKVLVQGTKERPKVVAPKPTVRSTPAPSTDGGSTPEAAPAPAAPVVTGDVWGQLAQCESGGNPSVVSSNGLYHGLYQFSVGTWQSLGGTGLPSQASPAEQTRLAQALQARSGWGQWPHCSSKLGLR